jgi:hypothetical protein
VHSEALLNKPVDCVLLPTDSDTDNLSHLTHPFAVEPRAQGEQEGCE